MNVTCVITRSGPRAADLHREFLEAAEDTCTLSFVCIDTPADVPRNVCVERVSIEAGRGAVYDAVQRSKPDLVLNFGGATLAEHLTTTDLAYDVVSWLAPLGKGSLGSGVLNMWRGSAAPQRSNHLTVGSRAITLGSIEVRLCRDVAHLLRLVAQWRRKRALHTRQNSAITQEGLAHA